MITSEILEETIFATIKKSSCHIPQDVYAAFEKAIVSENQSISKMALEKTLQSLQCSMDKGRSAAWNPGYEQGFLDFHLAVAAEKQFIQ